MIVAIHSAALVRQPAAKLAPNAAGWDGALQSAAMTSKVRRRRAAAAEAVVASGRGDTRYGRRREVLRGRRHRLARQGRRQTGWPGLRPPTWRSGETAPLASGAAARRQRSSRAGTLTCEPSADVTGRAGAPTRSRRGMGRVAQPPSARLQRGNASPAVRDARPGQTGEEGHRRGAPAPSGEAHPARSSP